MEMNFSKRCFLIIVILATALCFSQFLFIYNEVDPVTTNELFKLEFINSSWRHLSKTQVNSLTKLGRILFMGEKTPEVKPTTKNYKILIWKYGPTIEKRHLYHFTNKKYDPFEKCSVQNCEISYKNEDLDDADIVIIHLHRTKDLGDLPPANERKKEQIWAFLTDESPYHTFLSGKNPLEDFNGIFNWSMTYRMDSDIPVPYGRTVLLEEESDIDLPKHFTSWKETKRKDVLVAIMGSNCGSKNHRWEYVKSLQTHIDVDAYGKCGTLKCMGHFNTDCPLLNNYMFYMAFENGNCDEYITEKVWWNAYHKNAIPIVMGASEGSYRRILPPYSYINVDEFASPRDLATYLRYLNNTPNEFLKYFQWKKYFKVLNEHGYFQSESFHYCRVCEALNYNSRDTKIYRDLKSFWSVERDCRPGWM